MTGSPLPHREHRPRHLRRAPCSGSARSRPRSTRCRRSDRATSPRTAAASPKGVDRPRPALARLVCWGEPCYPETLANIEDAPPVLTWLGGHSELLAASIVAIVGACSASANCRRCRGISQPGSQGRRCARLGGIESAAHGRPLPTVRSLWLPAASTSLSGGESWLVRCAGARERDRRGATVRHRTADALRPAPQPHHLGYVARRLCRRGRGEIWVADQRPFLSRARPQDIHGGVQFAARSEEPRSCATPTETGPDRTSSHNWDRRCRSPRYPSAVRARRDPPGSDLGCAIARPRAGLGRR